MPKKPRDNNSQQEKPSQQDVLPKERPAPSVRQVREGERPKKGNTISGS